MQNKGQQVLKKKACRFCIPIHGSSDREKITFENITAQIRHIFAIAMEKFF
jgi:hypothetical protein